MCRLVKGLLVVVDHHHLGLGRRIHVLSRLLLLVIRIGHHHPQLIVNPDRTLQLRPERLLPGIDLPFFGRGSRRHFSRRYSEAQFPRPSRFSSGKKTVEFLPTLGDCDRRSLGSRGSQEEISSGVRREFSSVPVHHSRGFLYQRESLLFSLRK
jgi:hypothetical protein